MHEAGARLRAPRSATAISRSAFSPIGISKAFFSIGVCQVTSPIALLRGELDRLGLNLALALAIATACRAARAMPSVVTSLVAAKPQVPAAMTRTPTP